MIIDDMPAEPSTLGAEAGGNPKVGADEGFVDPSSASALAIVDGGSRVGLQPEPRDLHVRPLGTVQPDPVAGVFGEPRTDRVQAAADDHLRVAKALSDALEGVALQHARRDLVRVREAARAA